MMKRKVAHGAAIMASFQIVSRILDMLALLVLARLLVPADFGLVAIATSVLLVLTALTELPVIDVLVQRGQMTDHDVDAAFTTNIIRGLIVAALMALIAFPVARIYADPRLISLICVLGAVPFGKSMESPALVHSVRDVNYKPTAYVLVFGKFCGAIVSIATAFVTQSYWSLVAGVTTASVASALWSYVLAPYRPKIEFKGVWSLLNFAGWVTLSRIFFTISQQGDRFFIGHILGTARLGQYTLGGDISSVATNSLAAPILRPMFAGMARIQADIERLRAAYIKCQQVLTMTILPIGIGLAVVANLLVPLLLGPEWIDVRIVIWWIAPVVALQMLSVPVQAASMARARPEALALREGAALLLRLPATLIAASYYGLQGAVIARAITGIAIILFNMSIANQLIGLSVIRQLLAVWRSLVSAAVMAAVVLLIEAFIPTPEGFFPRSVELVGFVLVGGAVYFSTHLVLWRLCKYSQGAETFALEVFWKWREKRAMITTHS